MRNQSVMLPLNMAPRCKLNYGQSSRRGNLAEAKKWAESLFRSFSLITSAPFIDTPPFLGAIIGGHFYFGR